MIASIGSGRSVQRGATALIVVIFSTLLLMTITVSFMRLVVQDQQRANDDELSRGAYDSALAGVEDGKRVLQACSAQGAGSAACVAINNAKCSTVQDSKVLGTGINSDSEISIQNSSGTTGGYNQAYTCVVINQNTTDYKDKLKADISTVIPLQATAGYDKIKLSWFLKPNSVSSANIDLGANGTWPAFSKWSPVGKTRPPMIRAQLVQFYAGNFKLDDMNQSGGSNTLYLYPTALGQVSTSFALDTRTTGASDIQPVTCNAASVTYVCNVTLTLPLPVGMPSNPTPAQIAERVAYLRLTSFYGDADISVQFANPGVLFQNVEPSIDSTGRASNAYRRVEARVQQVSALAYPRATVDIKGNFCKDFGVSDTTYYAGACTP